MEEVPWPAVATAADADAEERARRRVTAICLSRVLV